MDEEDSVAQDPQGILEILDMTFFTIHHHLVTMMESTEINWDDPKVIKGVESMIALDVVDIRVRKIVEDGETGGFTTTWSIPVSGPPATPRSR